MAAAAVQGEQLYNILTCSICFEIFNDPRTLPCLHTFCFQCISQWCRGKPRGAKVACPECRNEFVIPDDGFGGLKKNFLIGNLLGMKDNKQLQKPSTATELCEICDREKGESAEMFCLQCEQMFCKSCSNAHARTKISSSHTLVSYASKKVNTFACEIRTELKQDIQTIANAQRRIDENLTHLNSKRQSFREQVKAVETEICMTADQMIQLIEIHKQKLISELHEVTSKCEQAIDAVTQQLNQTKVSLISCTSHCDDLLKKGSDIDINQEAASLSRQARELANVKTFEETLKNLDTAKVTFSPSSLTFDGTKKNVVGELLKGNNHWRPKMKSSGVKTSDKNEFSQQRRTPITAHNLLVGAKNVHALTLLNGELFVTGVQDKHVTVYQSTTLEFKRSISVHRLGQSPFGLAACPLNKLLFISDWDNDCVHRVDLPTHAIIKWKTAAGPRGLSLTSKQNLLVTCASSPMRKVQEYTATGSLVRELCLDNYPYHAVETSSGTLLISRSGQTNSIAEFTWGGRVLRCCSVQSQMHGPRSMAVTSNGILIASDEDNNRIQVLDASLAAAYTLQLPAKITLNKPSAICYDESRGRLFVGECYGEHRVLAFDNVTNLHVMFE